MGLQSIERSASEIRGILIALTDVSNDSAFPNRIAELRKQATVSADHAEALARQLVDHVVSRGLLAVALVLLMLLGYGRLKRRGASPS
ncbi:MAG: hypothetical protein O3C57_03175 [Verrucomicrobia bacterium]|nr:hypothetical protein [Verrucomicrobiota bacterium]